MSRAAPSPAPTRMRCLALHPSPTRGEGIARAGSIFCSACRIPPLPLWERDAAKTFRDSLVAGEGSGEQCPRRGCEVGRAHQAFADQEAGDADPRKATEI